jgi:hypothetical protein
MTWERAATLGCILAAAATAAWMWLNAEGED